MLIRLIVGLSGTAIIALLALRRVLWLAKLTLSGQPVTGRTDDIGTRIWTQIAEVFGQRRLLKWSIPGLAHFFTMWGFFILITVYIEAYGTLFVPNFHIPIVGRWDALGFLQDFIALAVLAGITTFAIIRLRSEPKEYGRSSRFYGSHTGGAWLILFMISLVIVSYAIFRGAAVNTGNFPYGGGAFFSHAMGTLMHPLGVTANEWIETSHCWLTSALPLPSCSSCCTPSTCTSSWRRSTSRSNGCPTAWARCCRSRPTASPSTSKTRRTTRLSAAARSRTLPGRATSTSPPVPSADAASRSVRPGTPENRCPPSSSSWTCGTTGWPRRPTSSARRTPSRSRACDLETAHEEGHHVPESGFGRVPGHGPEQASRPLVGTAEQGGVIDPDVLWSCVNCGACVEQCPVDIEHIDHIVDMRRYQVMMESEFPSELSVLFKNLETKANPWGQNASDRTNWISEVDFDVPVYGEDVDSFEGFEYLFWVGCAGAYDDKAKKTTKAVAELLATAGVKYLVLGTGETCNGDSARRSGNEFLFQQLAAQAKESLDGLFEGVETVDRKIVVTCPHCFNTLGREYKQLGANYTVLHHTQLLNRLVRDKQLVPVSPVSQDITYHDPCFLGRHNKVYEAPRELIAAAGAKLTEMPRHADRSFCCGAGGARMWMEEHIGKRINHDRVDEALATGATTVATACPFCRVMITDGVNDRQEAAGREGVDVRDVAQLLLESLDRSTITLPEKGAAAKAAAERAEKAEKTAPTAQAASTATATAPAKEAAEPEAAAPAEDKTEAKAVTGLGIAGGAKRPGAKKTAPKAEAAQAPSAAEVGAPPASGGKAPEAKAPAAPVKGLGIAGGAKRPGAKKTAAKPEAATPAAPAAEPATTSEPAAEAKAPAAPVKGLGIAAGAKRPGAKKAATPAAPAAPRARVRGEGRAEIRACREPRRRSAGGSGQGSGHRPRGPSTR